MKNFDEWNDLKRTLNSQNTVPLFREREIWWCSIGLNIGHEQDGKNRAFNRPVLIIKKFNNRLFWGVPLSTKIKNSPHYHTFIFKDVKQSALLTQLRLLDANRITKRMGRMGNKQFNDIKITLRCYLQ